MEVKVKLKIKDIEVELSMSEVNELRKLLEKITGKETIVEKEIIKEKEYWPWYPYRPPVVYYWGTDRKHELEIIPPDSGTNWYYPKDKITYSLNDENTNGVLPKGDKYYN